MEDNSRIWVSISAHETELKELRKDLQMYERVVDKSLVAQEYLQSKLDDHLRKSQSSVTWLIRTVLAIIIAAVIAFFLKGGLTV